MSSPETSHRYIIADPDAQPGGGWRHFFREEGQLRDRSARFVFDLAAGSVLACDIQRDWKWHGSTEEDRANLADNLINANPDCLVDPEGWGLIAADELPDWAAPEGDGPSL